MKVGHIYIPCVRMIVKEPKKQMKAKINKKDIIALAILLIPVLLIGISNLVVYSGAIDGLLMTLLISLTIAIIWVVGLYIGYTERCIESSIKCVKGCTQYIKQNPKIILLHIGINLLER